MTDAMGGGPDKKVVLVLNTILYFDAVGVPTYGALPQADRAIAEADGSLILDLRDLYCPDDFVGNDVLGRWAERRGVSVEDVNVGDLLWLLSIDFLSPYIDEDTCNLIQIAVDNEDFDSLPSLRVCLHGDLVEATIEDLLPHG